MLFIQQGVGLSQRIYFFKGYKALHFFTLYIAIIISLPHVLYKVLGKGKFGSHNRRIAGTYRKAFGSG